MRCGADTGIRNSTCEIWDASELSERLSDQVDVGGPRVVTRVCLTWAGSRRNRYGQFADVGWPLGECPGMMRVGGHSLERTARVPQRRFNMYPQFKFTDNTRNSEGHGATDRGPSEFRFGAALRRPVGRPLSPPTAPLGCRFLRCVAGGGGRLANVGRASSAMRSSPVPRQERPPHRARRTLRKRPLVDTARNRISAFGSRGITLRWRPHRTVNGAHASPGARTGGRPMRRLVFACSGARSSNKARLRNDWEGR